MPPSPTLPAIGIASSSIGVMTDWNTTPGNSFRRALEAIEIAIRPAARQQRRIVGAGHRPIVRIGIVPNGLDLDRDLVADLLVGADMGEGRIAAEHPAVARVHHAAADRIAELKPDLVKASER